MAAAWRRLVDTDERKRLARLMADRESYATTCGGYSAGNQKEEEPPAHHSVGATSIGHSSMVKSSMGINIFAVLPLASNASCAVSAAMIVPAIMARTAREYFRIDTHKDRDRQTGFGRSLVREQPSGGRGDDKKLSALSSMFFRGYSVGPKADFFGGLSPLLLQTAQNGLPLSL